MKHVRKIMLALCGMAMLAGAASCKKEKAENGNDGDELRITASLERAAGNEKTHLEDNSVAWDGDDKFLLYQMDENTAGELFRYKEAVEGFETKAVFTGKRPGTTGNMPYYACYFNPNPPIEPDQLDQRVLRIEADEFEFTIPEEQPGNPDVQSATSYTGPMIGCMKTEAGGLKFKNVMSWLKVGLKGNVAVKRVVLTDKGGKSLHGTLTVSDIKAGDDGTITGFTTAMTGGSTLEIVSEEGVELNETSFTYFWFLVPVGSLESLKFDAYTSLADAASPELSLEKTIAGGMPENKILTADVTSTTIHINGADVTLAAGCSGEGIYQSNGSVTGRNATLTNYQVGICWNLADGPDPTYTQCLGKKTIGEFTIDKDATKEITYDLADLEAGQKYKIRLYAINGPVSYSGPTTVTAPGTPLPNNWKDGKSPLTFSISASETVRFSKGNLQYIGSTGEWKFAEYQFEFLGNNGQTGGEESLDRDLFGWGCTGNVPSGDSYYLYYQPWSRSTSSPKQYYNWYGYGPSANRGGASDLLVSNGSDWGANPISNGGNEPNKWRTLTYGQWLYLINRKDSGGRLLYGEGKVGNCTPGLIILPDDWSWTGDVAEFGPSVTEESRRWKPGKTAWSNVYSYSEWAKMEAAGAVFLPAGGNCPSIDSVGKSGWYWSSTHNPIEVGGSIGVCAYNLYFASSSVQIADLNHRYGCYSVRLVTVP